MFCIMCTIDKTHVERSSDCGHILCRDCWQRIYDWYEQTCPTCGKDNSVFLSEHFQYSENSINKYKHACFLLISDLQKALQLLQKYKDVASSSDINREITQMLINYNEEHYVNVANICDYPYDSEYDKKKYTRMFKDIVKKK